MKVAIAGYGIEGKVSCRYWHARGCDVTVVDERAVDADDVPEGVHVQTGTHVFEELDGFDVVVRTASLPPSKIVTDGRIWSATNEFFQQCPARIVGVTGTKGKGTTSSMIASILRAAGKTVHLVGNIGVPALEVLPIIQPDDIVVFEMSSFQLWDIERSPNVSVVLMIEPDHLNVHENFEEYIDAKANIVRYQQGDDVCIYHPTNEYSRHIAGVRQSQNAAAVRRFGVKEDGQVYVSNGAFCVGEQKMCSVGALQLPGRHNVENACAALSAVVQVMGVSKELCSVYERALRDFQGLPHRIEYVRTVNGVACYNDSFSSAAGATVAAIESFPDIPCVVIIGGVDKGADFTELAKTLKKYEATVYVLLIGSIREKLQTYFAEHGVVAHSTDADTMDGIVQEALSHAQSGGVLLLSPGCASFDMFDSFYDRGEKFKDSVRKI